MNAAPEEAALATWRTSDNIIQSAGNGLSPHDRVMLALDSAGFGGARPKCPSCPPTKRRGFTIKEARTATGAATVLLHCHRGCTVEEVLAALGLDPSDLYGGEAQGRLFDGTRYSPVDLDGLLALPSSSARNFCIAGCLGSFLARDRSFRQVRGSAEILAVVLSRRQRRRAREVCGIESRRWRQLIVEWEGLAMAHRCNPEQVTLFRHPEAECPNCGNPASPASFPVPRALHLTRKNGESGSSPSAFEHRVVATVKAAVILPLGGSNPSAFEHFDPLKNYDGEMAAAYLVEDNLRRDRQRAKLHNKFLERKARGELSEGFLRVFPEHRLQSSGSAHAS